MKGKKIVTIMIFVFWWLLLLVTIDLVVNWLFWTYSLVGNIDCYMSNGVYEIATPEGDCPHNSETIGRYVCNPKKCYAG